MYSQCCEVNTFEAALQTAIQWFGTNFFFGD
jgi:hypothetical protein